MKWIRAWLSIPSRLEHLEDREQEVEWLRDQNRQLIGLVFKHVPPAGHDAG